VFEKCLKPHGGFFDSQLYFDTIRYDTIGEFNVDWKAEYSALF